MPGPAPVTWPNASADRGYVLYFTGRCGSTHLIDLLAQTGLCGRPDEFFNENFLDGAGAGLNDGDVAGYIHRLVAERSAGRRFGFKVDGLRHRRLCSITDPLAHFPREAFGYVYLTRRNILEQAYSYAHAKRVGVWHRTRDDIGAASAAPVPSGDIGDRALWQEIAYIVAQESHFEGYFAQHALPVERIDYESLSASGSYVVAKVMIAAGRTLDEIEGVGSTLRDRHLRVEYTHAKVRRLLDFEGKFREPLAYVASLRGRRSGDAARQFFRQIAGVDIESV